MKTRTEKNQEIQSQLEEEQKQEYRKKVVCFCLKLIFFIILLFTIIFLYTKYCSTTGLIVKEERIKNEKIPNSFNGIKLVHFSDLYYGSSISMEEVKKLVKIINIRKPDLIVFTGNLIDPRYKISTKEQEQLTKELKKLDTTIGKYSNSGKTDKAAFNTIMSQSNFQILNNDYDLIYNNDNNPILMIGLSSLIKKERKIEEAYRYFKEENHNSNIYTISIMSETDDLDTILNNYQNDLILAGNSLNGQIRIPLIGGMIPQEGSKKYKEEYYEKKNTEIYISSGIGSPDLGFRLFARPSINFFRLTKKNSPN
ncbi:MAG: hypothetical protein HFJ12_05060 [Bacilli bacterium]|nr:hypothetical protein [Bacilli bacterium]